MSDDKHRLEADRSRRQFLAYLVAGGATVPLAACTEASELSGAADEGSHNPLLWAVAWQQTAAEFARRQGDFEQGQSHQLQRQKFVVGEKVQHQAALFFTVQLAHVGKVQFVALLPAVQFQGCGAPRYPRRFQRRPWMPVVTVLWPHQFLFPGGAKEYALGQFPDFHIDTWLLLSY